MPTPLPFRMELGARYQAWRPASWIEIPGRPDAELLVKFPPGAFDSQLGSLLQMRRNDGIAVAVARMISADVAPDGSGCMFTFEIIHVAALLWRASSTSAAGRAAGPGAGRPQATR